METWIRLYRQAYDLSESPGSDWHECKTVWSIDPVVTTKSEAKEAIDA